MRQQMLLVIRPGWICVSSIEKCANFVDADVIRVPKPCVFTETDDEAGIESCVPVVEIEPMIRPSLTSGLSGYLSGFAVVLCLVLVNTDCQAQLTGGATGGGATGGNTNTGGLIGGGTTGNGGGGLIGADAVNQAAQQGIRNTGNFQSGFGGATGGGGGQNTRQFGTTGRGGTGGARGGGQVTAPRRVIRPVLRIAFDYPLPQSRVASSLNQKLDRVSIRLNNRFRRLGLEVGEKGLVTLRGEVQSESDKKLAAAYVRLEPGVRKIQNDLVVVVAPQK